MRGTYLALAWRCPRKLQQRRIHPESSKLSSRRTRSHLLNHVAHLPSASTKSEKEIWQPYKPIAISSTGALATIHRSLYCYSTVFNMISDDDLYRLAIFLGSIAMVLIVVYHFFEVNSQEESALAQKAARTTPAQQSAAAAKSAGAMK
ncbi:Oligosaccaryltransferase-domain-containing protein [Xylariaceae sp. FL0016]|nr:Oligosaccaryltransferase-domain-containing protein [Xylariaceae sp. FL0016]